MKSYVYILFSRHFGRFYIGISSDLEQRLRDHNRGKVKSTKAYVPWVLLYKEEFSSKQEARKREQYFKSSAGRRWRKQYVQKLMGD